MPGNIGRTMLKQYLAAHEDVMTEIERSTGKRPAPYKDLEEKVLLELFERMEKAPNLSGLDFMVDLLSGLITGQGLPNANHRTAMYFAGVLLKQHGLEIDTVRHAHAISEYMRDSKHMLEKAKKGYEEQHLELTKRILEEMLGSVQSGRLGSILAYSIMNSFAASSKDRTFSGSAMNEE
jgi:prophage maintenance system killer protein